jgi:phosphoribosylamine--glycine ligase / phosphoribosylformylglycinamidine cyclo-ligase
MKVLVIGGGGREHAIAWKLEQSPKVSQVFVAPGNAGTHPNNVNISVTEIGKLLEFTIENQIDFVVIGPDDPLAAGIVDAFTLRGIRTFGPTQSAAKLEWSKAFAKEIMREVGVKNAEAGVFESLETALAFVRSNPFSSPGFVVKADGLALGKGVIVCDDLTGATQALERIFSGEFGEAGSTVLVEERMTGPELSVLAFVDGQTIKLMPTARDHKRIGEGDTGANTGGMGAFAPVSEISAAMLEEIKTTILEPVVRGMNARGIPYKGVLYAGLMLTPNGIRVIEFNSRFGDPETQVILPLLETDLLEIFEACVDGTLSNLEIKWKSGACATVVIASPGYPASYPKGLAITGLEHQFENALIFHAGTKLEAGNVVTNGGRVLNVTGIGENLELALKNAYTVLEFVRFDGMQFRRDIGKTASNNALPTTIPVAEKPVSSYASSGVNIAEGTRAVQLMKDAVKSTHDARVLAGVGAFGGMYDASALKNLETPVLVASTDGVGTKTKIAAKLNLWDGIGADIVNHGINDILVQGAKPLFFMDYIAASKLSAELVARIVSSMARACKAANCVLLGGETAEMPNVYLDGELDVAGTIVGVVDLQNAVDGSSIQVGDAILAFPSSGLHTNGYSLARKVLENQNWSEVRADLNGSSIGQALLAPHRSYLDHVSSLQNAGIAIHGMAHITGGGLWDNVPRVLPETVSAVFTRGSWVAPPIFKLIATLGAISEHELFHAFNMGIGFIAVVPKEDAQKALELLKDECHLIGEIQTRATEAVVLV